MIRLPLNTNVLERNGTHELEAATKRVKIYREKIPNFQETYPSVPIIRINAHNNPETVWKTVWETVEYTIEM